MRRRQQQTVNIHPKLEEIMTAASGPGSPAGDCYG
jgi:hypothetical protein